MKNKKEMEASGVGTSCVGVHELIDWQIVQYRQAVDAHRTDLSKAEGRCVAWQEAEKDFSASDRTKLGEKGRVEYCGLICPHREKCLVALQFFRSKNMDSLYRVG